MGAGKLPEAAKENFSFFSVPNQLFMCYPVWYNGKKACLHDESAELMTGAE
jgi:hypothetical protein